MARLDRLATVKVVAQLGATIGRTFAYDLLEAVTPLDATALQEALVQLVEAELVAQRGVRPRPRILSSTHSSRMPPISRCCGAHDSNTISGLPRCWSSGFPS